MCLPSHPPPKQQQGGEIRPAAVFTGAVCMRRARARRQGRVTAGSPLLHAPSAPRRAHPLHHLAQPHAALSLRTAAAGHVSSNQITPNGIPPSTERVASESCPWRTPLFIAPFPRLVLPAPAFVRPEEGLVLIYKPAHRDSNAGHDLGKNITAKRSQQGNATALERYQAMLQDGFLWLSVITSVLVMLSISC